MQGINSFKLLIGTCGLFLTLFVIQCRERKSTSQVKYGEPFLSTADTEVHGCLCFPWNKPKNTPCYEIMFGYIADSKQTLASTATMTGRFLFERYPIPARIEKDIPIEAALSTAEKTAIYAYSSDLYLSINKALRQGGERLIHWSDIIYAIASGLNKLRTHWGYKGIVYRVESVSIESAKEILKNYRVGHPIIEPSFLSTSREVRPWLPSFGDVAVRYEINSKQGVAIDKISRFSHETEVLFTPGSIFEVDSIELIEGPHYIKNTINSGDLIKIKLNEIESQKLR